MNTILITGASGFIGASLVEKLLDSSHCFIIGIGRSKDGGLSKENLDNPNYKYLSVDLSDKDGLFKAVRNTQGDGISCIYHLASINNISDDFKDYYKNSIMPTLNIIDLAKKFSVKKIVYAGSYSVVDLSDGGVYSEANATINPANTYGLAKYICESLFLLHLPQGAFLSIRLPGVVGARREGGMIDIFAKKLIESKNLELHSFGQLKRNALHISFACEALTKAAKAKIEQNMAIFVGSANSLSMKEIAYFLKQELDSKSEIILSPTQALNGFNASMDLSLAFRVLGFKAPKFEDSLKKYVEEIRGK